MADNMSKLSIDPNLVVFDFYCKSLSLILEKWQPFLWFWVMADIQDGRQHVKVVDWSKCSGVRFLLQVPIIDFREMAAIFVILGNGWHPRWLTTCQRMSIDPNLVVLSFYCKSLSLILDKNEAIFVILGNGWHPRSPTTCRSCRLTKT